MPTQLPSGQWRPRIRHPRTGKHLNPQTVIGGPSTYADEGAARRAEDEARDLLRTNARAGVTVREWWEEWTTDQLWLRPSESTNIHNRERTERFVNDYGHLPIRAIDDAVVREYRRAGSNDGTVPALRAMFNDAARADAGRLVAVNPFAGLRLRQSRGQTRRAASRRGRGRAAGGAGRRPDPAVFAAYLDVAIHEGMRPGELDALRWTDLDFTPGAETSGRTAVERQGAPIHRPQARGHPHHCDDPGSARPAAIAPARIGMGVHDAARPPLHAVHPCAPLEPCPVRCWSWQHGPVHGHPPSLRVVRVERAGAGPRRHCPALRPSGRWRVGAQAVWALRPVPGAVARP